MHAATAAHRRPTSLQYTQYILAAFAGLAETENRCLVPFNSFAEYAPELQPPK
jgi:hypothetical protein